MHPDSPDASMTQTYLDWVLEIPFGDMSKKSLKISDVENQLNIYSTALHCVAIHKEVLTISKVWFSYLNYEGWRICRQTILWKTSQLHSENL